MFLDENDKLLEQQQKDENNENQKMMKATQKYKELWNIDDFDGKILDSPQKSEVPPKIATSEQVAFSEKDGERI